MDDLDEKTIKKLRVKELRQKLEERGLDSSGLKNVLVKRLTDFATGETPKLLTEAVPTEETNQEELVAKETSKEENETAMIVDSSTKIATQVSGGPTEEVKDAVPVDTAAAEVAVKKGANVETDKSMNTEAPANGDTQTKDPKDSPKKDDKSNDDKSKDDKSKDDKSKDDKSKDDRRRDDRDRDRGRDRGRDRDRDRDRDRRRRRDDRDRDDKDGNGKDDDNKRRKRSRSRDRRRSRRSRSRSRGHRSSRRRRSRSRDRRSRSRSVEAPRRPRKKSNWDKAPDQSQIQQMEIMAAQLAPMGSSGGGLNPAAVAMQLHAHMRGSHMSSQEMHQIQHMARQARRVYIGNVIPAISEDHLKNFMAEQVMKVPDRPPTPLHPDPVFSITVNHDKMFAFIEFHSKDDADIALCMDGIQVVGSSLKIRRPKDYTPPEEGPFAPKKWNIPGIISTHVENDKNKIFLGNLPTNLTDDEVKEFVTTFGPLKSFNLVKDSATGASKGYAFFAYVDGAVSEAACQGLNGIDLGGKEVSCSRANITPKDGISNVMNLDVLAPAISAPAGLAPPDPSRILVLQNLVEAEELTAEYMDIVGDIKNEAVKYGPVLEIIGHAAKVFVQYELVDSAIRAEQGLCGRKFNERTVLTAFLSEEDFGARKFD